MLKVTEKVTRYDIENLTEQDYSALKHLFMRNGCRNLPPVDFAIKVLKIDDVCMIYNIREQDLPTLIPSH